MSDTKLAISMLVALTVNEDDFTPYWLRALIALIHLGALAYLIWYLLRGGNPIEQRKSGR